MPECDTKPDQSSTQKPVDKLATALMAAAALTSVAGFGILFSVWWQTGIRDQYKVLRIASQEYVNGHPIIARDLAETVEFESESEDLPGTEEEDPEEPKVPDSELNEFALAKRHRERQSKQKYQEWSRLRDFLVGAGKVARANSQSDKRERRRLLRDALPYLQSAEKADFPSDCKTEGNRILGESMFNLGRYDEAIDSLSIAIELDSTLGRTLSPWLAEAELNSANKAPDSALSTIERFLRDPSLQPQQIWAGERIPKAAERRAAVGDLDRFTTSLAFPELEAPIRQLNDLQRDAMPPIPAQAKLWIARAELIAGHNDSALTLLTAVRLFRPWSPEAIVVGLEEIELSARQSRGEAVLQTTRYLMRKIGDQQGFQLGEVSFSDFRQRLTNSLEQLRQLGKFEHAIDSARALPPVFEPTEALIQETVSYQQWADATQIDGSNLSDAAACGTAQLARSRYRAAGDAYAQAAALMFDSEEYLPTPWLAIKAYQDGCHFSRSFALLEPCLRDEQRRRQPRGLVAFGRALLAEGDAEEAIDALTACIAEFHRDPLCYDARLLAVLAYSETGDLDTARQLLTEKLQDSDLAPASPAYRDSLFTLAYLLYQRGYRTYLEAERSDPPQRIELLRGNQPTLEKAVLYLDKVVERYRWISRAESAAYMSARTHILASRWPRIESESTEILDAARCGHEPMINCKSHWIDSISFDNICFPARMNVDYRGANSNDFATATLAKPTSSERWADWKKPPSPIRNSNSVT